MSLDDRSLREAWRKREPGTGESRVDPDTLWQAASGELPAEEAARVAEEAAGCAASAEAWRLARAMHGPIATDEQHKDHTGGRADRSFPLRPLLAAAALLLLAFAGWNLFRQSEPSAPPVLRESVVEIRSTLDEDTPLPRDAFVLRWEGTPEGSVYAVEIGTPDLRSLDRAAGLVDAEYRVPVERLESVAAGGRVAWRVEATLPDGRQITSVTFVNRVE